MTLPFRAEGAWTALVTPFDEHLRFDKKAYARLIEFQVGEGISGLVPAGTTGESPTLSWREHLKVIADAVKCSASRAGVLAGAGSNSTAEAAEGSRHAAEAGASAVLLMDCYYNAPSSLELRTEYYGKILDAVRKIPLVPYIIPGRCATALGAEDLAILHASNPNRVPAVKQATGDLERMRRDRLLSGPRLAILSGDDVLTLTMMQDPRIGASGVVSVISNIVPSAVARMVAAQRAGDLVGAAWFADVLAPLFKLVGVRAASERTLPNGAVEKVEDRFRNPVPIKTMMAGLGMPVGPCRPPLGRMPRAGVEVCRAALREVHGKVPELFAPLAKAFKVDIAQRLADDSVWAALTRP